METEPVMGLVSDSVMNYCSSQLRPPSLSGFFLSAKNSSAAQGQHPFLDGFKITFFLPRYRLNQLNLNFKHMN